MIYFTSDTHFGHTKVITYSNRPYKTIAEMNLGLIEKWNARVGKRDDVWHLGDFCFTKDPWEYRKQLNGRIHLILGNHDWRRISLLETTQVFESVQESKYLKYNGMRFWLSHYAHRTWPKSGKGAFHLYGHSHGDLPNYNRSMDVGVDANNYQPISIDEVVEKLKDAVVTLHHM